MSEKEEAPKIKTYVFHGLLTRAPGARHTREQYAHIDLVYNVDEGVTFDDIDYVFRQLKIARTVPIDIRTGEKLDFVIGVDNDRISDGGPTLNRVAFNKQLTNDVKKLWWVQP